MDAHRILTVVAPGRPPFLFALLLLAGCGGTDGTPGDGRTDADGEVDAADGDAFEIECPASGTCTPFEWGCDDDGRPVVCADDSTGWQAREPCAPGQTCDPLSGWCECGPCEVLADGVCVSVGAECAGGWQDDGACGCEPILDDCAEGEIPLIGGGCSPVGARDECGSGTWGLVPRDADTIHVDASWTGGASDGSESAPFTTIVDAIDAAPAEPATPTVIAVAAGEYREFIDTDKPVAIEGRCPSMVTLTRQGGWNSILWLSGDGSSLSGVTLDGEDAAQVPLGLTGGSDLLLEDVVITGGVETGVYFENAEGTLRRVTVTDTDVWGTALNGDAIQVVAGSGVKCDLVIEGADVHDTGRNGIFSEDCTLDVSRSRLVTQGLKGIRAGALDRPVVITLTENVMEDSGEFGIIAGARTGIDPVLLEISRNQIRDVHTVPGDYDFEAGISATSSIGTSVISGNHVESSDGIGILVSTPGCEVIGNIVTQTGGGGIKVQYASLGATVQDNTSRIGFGTGLEIFDSNPVEVTRNSIVQVSPEPGTGLSVAAFLQDSAFVDLSRNHLVDAEMGVLLLLGIDEISLRENRIEETDRAIQLQASSTVTSMEMTGNRIVDTSFGVIAMDVEHLSIRDNVLGPLDHPSVMEALTGFERCDGIVSAGVTDLTLTGNLLSVDTLFGDNVATTGMILLEVGGTIADNRVQGFPMVGVQLQAGGAVVQADIGISGNTVVGSRGVGIHLMNVPAGHVATLSGNRVAGVTDATWPNGENFGDGLVVLYTQDEQVVVSDNHLLGNARTGLFVSDSTVSASGNHIAMNEISLAWQDGADVSLEDNTLVCNASDQPWTDQGLAVPEPPSAGVPGP